MEELLANAIVHNNYENGKPIQIYVSEKQINIVNYNKPLPPIRISDLNERTFFNERDTENPEIRDMFKAIGIIESFGMGIGEAKFSRLGVIYFMKTIIFTMGTRGDIQPYG